MIGYPMTLRQWLNMFWLVLTAPEPRPVVKSEHAPEFYCPTCGQFWKNPRA